MSIKAVIVSLFYTACIKIKETLCSLSCLLSNKSPRWCWEIIRRHFRSPQAQTSYWLSICQELCFGVCDSCLLLQFVDKILLTCVLIGKDANRHFACGHSKPIPCTFLSGAAVKPWNVSKYKEIYHSYTCAQVEVFIVPPRPTALRRCGIWQGNNSQSSTVAHIHMELLTENLWRLGQRVGDQSQLSSFIWFS